MPNKPLNVMANARGRLLPFSLPFRFFLAACFYQSLMWVLLFLNPDDLITYNGGAGPILSAVHLLTLGVLLMTAVGASIQLLSVSTLRPMRSLMACRLLSWLLIPGVGILVYGMMNLSSLALVIGGSLVTIALLIYALLVFDNLVFASGMGVITAYIWAAILSLCMIVALGIALIMDYYHAFLQDHTFTAVTHMLLAAYGFMGMLSLGFSYILIPMFALAAFQNKKLAHTGFILNVIALLLLVVDLLITKNLLLWLAIFSGLTGSVCYLFSMYQILQQRMRKRLGFSFRMIYLSWCALPLSIVAGAMMKMGIIKPALFGVILLLAWLLMFLVGILQRIAPFLTTMHLAQGKAGKVPTQSELTSELSLKICNYAYIASLLLLISGLCFEQSLMIRIGSLVGLCAGLSLFYFLLNIVRIKRAHAHSVKPVAEARQG
ncbi:MAG: hypothetical protein HN764_14525 [Gammaproteobacteria bacterium]|jgi:hypothetical protein|nr:hypothetical protein [Gammaproteobacteria bacterium]